MACTAAAAATLMALAPVAAGAVVHPSSEAYRRSIGGGNAVVMAAPARSVRYRVDESAATAASNDVVVASTAAETIPAAAVPATAVGTTAVSADIATVATAATTDAADSSSTTLPDGVTWPQVRDYIDANLTGSKVFADAVYDAIRDSGQNYRDLTVSGDDADSAADVIAYFGVADPAHTTITVSEPLEDDAVLTGVTLLANVGTLKIQNVGNHTGLAFIEDAFTAAGDGREPHETPMGPAIKVGLINLTTLPKRPYTYNLTRSRSGQHGFNTTAYNDLSVTVVRDPKGGDARIDIDTTLTGRGASVDFGKDDNSKGKTASKAISSAGKTKSTGKAKSTGKTDDAGKTIGSAKDGDTTQDTNGRRTDGPNKAEPETAESNTPDDAAVIRPTVVAPTFGAWASEYDRVPTDRITADGNVVTMSIPSCGTDGDYQERVGFGKIYKHFGNTVEQGMSIDYLYRANVTYLNTVRVTGEATVLGDVKARKVDTTTGEPLELVRFGLYADKDATIPARQAEVDLSGEVRRNDAGDIVMKDVDPADTGEDGTVTFDYLAPGDYYLKEIDPPYGYDVADPNPTKVTVAGADTAIAGPAVTGGQGSEAKVLAASNTGRADDFRNASNWYTATNNITLTSKLDTVRVDDGVYIRNGGRTIAIRDFDAGSSGLTPLGDGGYTVTFGADESGANASETKRFATAAEAQDAINTMIKGKQLTCANAVIGIDAGSRVYHRAATDDDVVTIGNKPLPVHLRTSAAKRFTGGDFESDRFRFTIDGADGRGRVHETVGVKTTSALGDGSADFSPLTFDKTGSYEFTITEEVDESDTSVSYNPEGVSYRLWVDVEPTWLGKFEMDGSRAESAPGVPAGDAGSGSSGDSSDAGSGDSTDSSDDAGSRTADSGARSDPANPEAAAPDDAGDTEDTKDVVPRYQGLAAVVHAAKVMTGKNGEPVVGEREFIGTFNAATTNVAIKAADGSVTGFTPNPRHLNGLMTFLFTNVAKDTTLPRTGAAGLLAVSTAGLMLLIVGVLIATHESRRLTRP